MHGVSTHKETNGERTDNKRNVEKAGFDEKNSCYPADVRYVLKTCLTRIVCLLLESVQSLCLKNAFIYLSIENYLQFFGSLNTVNWRGMF